MKRIYLLIASAFVLNSMQGQVYLSEIHYDNSGTDANERIEVFGPAGTDLTGWTVVLYNGTGGASYNSSNLAGTIPSNCTISGVNYGVVVVNYPVDGIQNGLSDGIALVNSAGTVVEFLSYEGTITAMNGPAHGMTSTDIGAVENGSGTSAGSIQRNSTGNSWTTDGNGNTFGSCNTGFIVLPVKFGNVQATQQGSSVKIDWTNLTELDVVNYTIERSANGQPFVALSTVAARINNGSRADYSFFDAAPVNGVNLYRIQSLEVDGKMVYSVIVRVDTRTTKTMLTIYPNPAMASEVSFQATDLQKGNYSLQVYNAAGQQVQNKMFNHFGGFITESLNLPVGTKAGMYYLQIISRDVRLSKTFIVQ